MKKLTILFLMLAGLQAGAQNFTNYTTVQGLPSNNVLGVAVDSHNVKWFGTQSGVAKYNDTTWTTYTTTNGLIDNYINCIAVDASDHIWVGTDIGVSKFDGTTWTSFTTTNGLVNSQVNYISGHPDGSVWIGTSGGVSRFDGTTWKNYTSADGLAGDMISYIKVDQANNVWLGTWIGGLSKFNGTGFTNFTTADSLPDNNVSSIGIGANNTKWIGTYYGVAVYDNSDKWIATYRAKDGLFNKFVMDIAMDARGSMWFGMYDLYTQDPGLSRKGATGWKSFTVTDGLINAQVKRIAVDKSDHLWSATAAGVSKLSDTNAGLSEISPFPLQVYPNPATDEIHLDGLTSAGSCTLNTATGKVVVSASLQKGSNTISTSGLNPGIYIVKCALESGIYTGKLIIR